MSPISAQTVLSLLYIGSAGSTKEIMASALDFQNETQADIAENFQNLLKPSKSNKELSVANALYISDRYNIDKSYASMAKNDFYSLISTINFNEPDAAAQNINSWVSDETHGKINDVISPGDIDSNSGIVVVNAIYYKGAWQYNFAETNPAPFYPNGICQGCAGSKQVQMMQLTVSMS